MRDLDQIQVAVVGYGHRFATRMVGTGGGGTKTERDPMQILLVVYPLIARRQPGHPPAELDIALALMVIAVVLIAAIVNHWRMSRPLDPGQVERLAEKRRSRLIHEHYNFRHVPLALDTTFKKSMRPDGSFHSVDYPLHAALSITASHLKYKKHEWVVFLFCAEHRVLGLWCNKGPDSTKVAPSLDTGALGKIASSTYADLVVRMHNHPNPHSAYVSLLGPSEQDLRSSRHFAEAFNACGINFLDVVCERGEWVVYGEGCLPSFFPYDRVRSEVVASNGRSGADNRRLQRELRDGSSRVGAGWH